MKFLVTGVNGQLGYDVMKLLTDTEHEAIGVDREEMDITNQQAVQDKIVTLRPDIIVHCAAYTAVDKAESDQDNAYQVNALGTKYIAEAAKDINAKMIYVSTDYVFDGNAEQPYEVDHPSDPMGIYGQTKLAGENFVKEYLDKYFIVRTAWVFGSNGKNFVKTMLRLGKERGEVGVVSDQSGSPTYTPDLATFLLELAESDKYGTYHATNSGVCTWYEFAVEIFKQAGIEVKVNPLTTEQYPTPAKRPKYSVLSKAKIEEQGFTPLPDWKDALNAFLKEIGEIQ